MIFLSLESLYQEYFLSFSVEKISARFFGASGWFMKNNLRSGAPLEKSAKFFQSLEKIDNFVGSFETWR